jgi:hypothetical protein
MILVNLMPRFRVVIDELIEENHKELVKLFELKAAAKCSDCLALNFELQHVFNK